jgi:hypothetical protein
VLQAQQRRAQQEQVAAMVQTHALAPKCEGVCVTMSWSSWTWTDLAKIGGDISVVGMCGGPWCQGWVCGHVYWWMVWC